MIMRRELSTGGWLTLLIAALGLSGNMTGDAVSQESKKNRPTDPALATKQQPTVPEPTEEQLKKARQIPAHGWTYSAQTDPRTKQTVYTVTMWDNTEVE